MKEIVAKTGEYTNQQGETKAEWTKIGVIGVSQSGNEYVLLDPTVNLAGVLTKQNIQAAKEIREGNTNAKISGSIMCSVFSKDRQQASHGGYQQPSAPQPPAAPQVPVINEDVPF